MKPVTIFRSLFSLLIVSVMGLSDLYAQAPAQVQVKTNRQAVEGEGFTIEVTSSNPSVSFSKVTIGYRQPNDEFVRKEMKFANGKWSYEILSDESIAPSLEYYIIAETATGTTEYFPAANFEDAPAQIQIQPRKMEENVTFLMGEPGQRVAPEDLIVMLSYYRVSEVIDLASIKLVVNGNDVTSEANVSADALTWLPSDTPEKGDFSFEFSAKLKDGTVIGPVSWQNTIVSAEEALEEEQADENYNFGGNSWYEYRFDKVGGTDSTGGTTRTINRFSTTISGNAHWFGYYGNVYLTSEEDEQAQASNRYTLKLAMGEYLDLGFGDVYPSFSRLMMNGNRVRGFEGNLKSDWINVDFVMGTLNRKIDPTFSGGTIQLNTAIETEKDSLETLLGSGYVQIAENGNFVTVQKRDAFGAYDRDVISGKVTFGSKKEGFNYGVGVLLAKDDTTSNLYGDAPTANMVVGMDTQLRYDNGRFELYGDIAFSVRNSDMKAQNPELKQEVIDALGQSTYDFIDAIFPISAGIEPPSFGSTALLFNSIAAQAGLKLNYWNNYFKIEYIRNGNSFRSDGLSFYQADIGGIKINDRLRLFNNKFFLNFGLDLLSDNLDGQSKNYTDDTGNEFDGTTDRTTLRAGFSVFPGAGYPSFSFDYINNSNQNALPDYATASTDFSSNSIILSTNYSFSVSQTFHSLGLSYSMTDKVDNRDKTIYLYQYGLGSYQQNSNSLILNYGTTLEDDISANVSYNFSSSTNIETVLSDSASAGTKNPGTPNYASDKETELTFNIIEASAYKGFFQNLLKVGARANLTFSEVNQYIFGGSAEYTIFPSLVATSDLNILLNEGVDNDILLNFRLQYNF